MSETIKEMIRKYEEPGDFTYAKVTDAMIKDAEAELNLKLPEQYAAFLNEYGHGGIAGICTNGVGLDGSMVFLDETMDYRNDGLPDNLIVIESCDEWLYCIGAETGEIVSWDMSGYIKPEYDCFDSYLIGQMRDAIENL